MNELNVARWVPRTSTHGPGERLCLWTQGCDLACPGCCNKDLWTDAPAVVMSVENMFSVIRGTAGIDGVTYSGGEPFAQAAALAELSRRVHGIGLTVMCYSGWTIEEMLASNDPDKLELLAEVDLLVDGRFVYPQRGKYLWRGSANQRLIRLSDRIPLPAPEAEGVAFEVQVGAGDIRVVGFPPSTGKLVASLRSQGIALTSAPR